MKQFTQLAVAAATLLLGACAEDSSLPNATGKGTVRAINALPTSSEINFLIEERTIGTAGFRGATGSTSFDDLVYNFNFELVVPGDNTFTRVATVPLDVQADTDYTFILSGNLASPDIMLIENAVREYEGDETVYDVSFGHTAPGLGAFDVYFDPPGTPPALGNEVAALAFGDISDPLQLEAADRVLTLTAPGDPATVLFESDVLTLTAANSYLISTFDSTANDIGPVAVSLLNLAGRSGAAVVDINTESSIRFYHASRDFATADVYVDEPPTTPLLMDLAFGDVTGDVTVPAGDLAVTYTQAGNVGMILLEEMLTLLRGTRLNFYVVRNSDDEDVLLIGSPNRRSIANQVQLFITNTADDNSVVDVYVVPAGESVDDSTPLFFALPTLFPLARAQLVAGSYDLYLTTPSEKTVLFGPLSLDANLGDVLEFIIYDTVDPAVPDVVNVPLP